MKLNRNELCEECNSHMIAIKTPTRIIYECSYCGSTNIEVESIEEIDYE